MKTLSDEKFRCMYGDWVYEEKDVKEFVKWVETEIILKSPKRRQNLIKLQNRVGKDLI